MLQFQANVCSAIKGNFQNSIKSWFLKNKAFCDIFLILSWEDFGVKLVKKQVLKLNALLMPRQSSTNILQKCDGKYEKKITGFDFEI